jgi:hypothetical protein
MEALLQRDQGECDAQARDTTYCASFPDLKTWRLGQTCWPTCHNDEIPAHCCQPKNAQCNREAGGDIRCLLDR